MKQIVAYFQRSRRRAVELALHRLEDSPGVNFAEVRGLGNGRIPRTRRPPLIYDLLECRPCPYARIEILSADEQVSEIVSTIEAAAGIGCAGNGKIYVLDACRTESDEAEAQRETALAVDCSHG